MIKCSRRNRCDLCLFSLYELLLRRRLCGTPSPLLKQKEWNKLTNSASFSPIFSLLLSAAFYWSQFLYSYTVILQVFYHFESNNAQNN